MMPSPGNPGESRRLVGVHQPNRPERRGTRVVPIRATPPPAMSCLMPWDFIAGLKQVCFFSFFPVPSHTCKQGTPVPFCASACWWRCPQTPVPRSPSSCGCASFYGKTLFSKNRICVKCRYRSCFFCAASSLCSIGSFRIRSTFARTVSSSRISFFASLYSA